MNINEFCTQYPQYADMSDTELSAALHAKHYSDMPKHAFDLKFIGRPNHDDLNTAAVTAKDSLTLQNIDPEIKPVIVGTNQEILDLKRKGQIGRGKDIFMAPNGKTYVIDAKAVQGIYGVSLAGSVKMAKMDILKGNDARLLGYPDRDKGANVDVAVNKQGEILTDLPRISDEAKAGNVAYAAEALPQDALTKGAEVSQAIRLNQPRKWKTIGGDNEGNTKAENAKGNADEGNEGAEDAERKVDDTQSGETAPQVTGRNLTPSVMYQGNQLTGGDTHTDILENHGINTSEGERGFMTPEGQFLNRKQGMDYLKMNQPDIYEKVKNKGELHSENLNKAYNG